MIKKSITAIVVALIIGTSNLLAENNSNPPFIEVTGSATINIVPDLITLEIGMEEYYKQKVFGDSILVKLEEIEKSVRKTLNKAGVPDSRIIISDLGNYRNRDISTTFLMAKRISATIGNFNQLEEISRDLDRKGITSFNIVKTDNSEMERYNREGLKAALDAARSKAEFIAENEGLQLNAPYEIVETTDNPSGYGAYSNAVYDNGTGMEGMRRIKRRYSVKVRYLFNVKNAN